MVDQVDVLPASLQTEATQSISRLLERSSCHAGKWISAQSVHMLMARLLYAHTLQALTGSRGMPRGLLSDSFSKGGRVRCAIKVKLII